VSRALPARGDAASSLIAAIEDFADGCSNPVLAVLDGVAPVADGRKYPAKTLEFGGDALRAYYHCHPAANRFAGEHGHFHVFRSNPRAATAAERWTHLAGLSMDGMGQPLAWFAVNLWVTGGAWLPAREAAELLDGIVPAAGMTLTERWLCGMLGVYRDELEVLLDRRDRRLMEIKAQSPGADILHDRDIYALAEQPVHLFDKLRAVLAGVPGGAVAVDEHTF
jgi:hypothetical protein